MRWLDPEGCFFALLGIGAAVGFVAGVLCGWWWF